MICQHSMLNNYLRVYKIDIVGLFTIELLYSQWIKQYRISEIFQYIFVKAIIHFTFFFIGQFQYNFFVTYYQYQAVLMPPKKDLKASEQPQKQPQPEPRPFELVGYGKFQYINGVIYEGNWKTVKAQKMKNGFGRLTIPTVGDTLVQYYEGDWFQDKMQGYGIYSYPDGSIYRGEWRDGKQEGRGQFQFANGTRYVGSWKGHCMDGFGEYTDHLGRKWAGEYRDGVFDSRRQRDLVKSIELEERSEHVKEAVLSVAARLVKLIEDSNQEIYRISPFFLRSEETDKLVRCKPLKYDDLTSDRWAQILQSLKKQKLVVLRDRKDSKILHPNQIIANQLEGIGQIVEGQGDGGYSVAILCVNTDQWIIVAAGQIKL